MALTQRVHDTFTDTAFTALASHTPDQGDSWIDVAAGLGINVSGNLLRTSGGTINVSLNETVLADKQAVELVGGNSGSGDVTNWGVLDRASGTSGGGEGTLDGYLAIWVFTIDEVQLYRTDNGGFTQLGSGVATTYADDSALRLESDGTTHTTFYGGVQKQQQTDATYASGKVGIRAGTNTSDFADDFKAFDDEGLGPQLNDSASIVRSYRPAPFAPGIAR